MDKPITIRVSEHRATAKMKNSRVQVALLHDDTIGLGFKIFSPGDVTEPRAKHQIIKDKVVVTNLRISRQCAEALFASLHQMLFKEE